MDTNENDINIVCISNGNEELFDNTLTSFKNKLPITIEWKKNGNFRYHIALDSIGFCTNFVTTILPDRPGIPSFIMSRQLKPVSKQIAITPKNVKTQPTTISEPTIIDFHQVMYSVPPKLNIPPHSDCVSLNSMPDTCNTTLLNANTKIWTNENAETTFKYFFLEDELFNTKRFIEFFKMIVEHSEKTLTMELDASNQYITMKGIGKFSTDGESSINSVNIPTFIFIHHTLAESIEIEPIEASLTNPHQYTMYKFAENMYNTVAIIQNEVYYKYYLHKGFQHLKISLLKVNKKKIPNIIKLQFDGIRDQIFNSTTSRDLICFHPNLEHKENEDYFFHEVERKTFYPLENTILDTLKFKLVDENDRLLRLNTGIATVIKLQFRKMPYFKKSFSVRLTSEISTLHPENTNANFTVELPETLYFNKKWRVSVNTINLPNYFNTLPPNTYVSVSYKKGTEKVRGTIRIENKVFQKAELIEYLNFRIRSYFKHKEPLVTFEENIQQGEYHPTCVIKIHRKDLTLSMSKNLALLLGYGAADFVEAKGLFFKVWDNNTLSSKGYHEIRMRDSINVKYFAPSYIMLYSNIVTPTIIGGTYTNILKIFPIITTTDDYVIHQFKNPEYHTLLNNEIKNINLQFRTHSGDFIYFSSKERVIVDLTFSNFE